MKRKAYFRILISASIGTMLSTAALADDFPGDGHPRSNIHPSTWGTPFNEVAQVACHNCYENKYATTFKSVLDTVRTVEIDIYDHRDLVTGGSENHWFVRHLPGTLFQSGNDNNCTGNGNGTNDFEACLKDIKAWTDSNPQHFPITIVVDKKQGWSKDSSKRTPKEFDELLVKVFGNKIYTPKDLATHVGSTGALQTDITGKRWPTAQELVGKILVVLNHTENERLSEYVDNRGIDAKAFVAPVTNGQNDITGEVSGMSRSASNWVVMNNMNKDDKAWAQHVYASGHIGRVWGDDDVSFDAHRRERVNLSAYYNFANYGNISTGSRITPFEFMPW
jgi:hypothetical protein